MKPIIRFALAATCLILAAATAEAQPQTKTFRGKLGTRTITLALQLDGLNLSGVYFYDGIGQNLTLQGRRDAKGNLRLDETDPTGKKTGQFAAELKMPNPQEDRATLEGTWMPPGKSDKLLPVSLTEQDVRFSPPLRVTTKRIVERNRNLSAAYPELVGVDSPGVTGFNRAVAALVAKRVAEFKTGKTTSRTAFETDYVIAFGTDDIVSVEISEYVDFGGAHPNDNHFALTWDLRTGKEIKFADVFKPKSNYLPTVLAACAKDIERQFQALGEQSSDTFSDTEYLKENFSGTWALTRRGVVVYFEFPHVAAALARTFVPFRDIEALVSPASPVDKVLPRRR